MEATADVLGAPGRQMHMLSNLLTAQEIALLHKAALCCTAYDSEEEDTVDKQATFQAYVFEAGSASAGAAEVARLLQPVIEERLLPYVRQKFGCPDACVADVLLRRYRPDERTSLNLHYDVQALATAIIPLSEQAELEAECTEAQEPEVGRGLSALTQYAGGLFVQGGAARSTRRFVRFSSPGDTLVHQFDLMHGVELRKGTRYALALWFSDSPASRTKGAAPWVRAAAEQGNADAQFLTASFCAQGKFGTQRDEAAVTRWLEAGAAQGHAVSALGLGRHCLGQGRLEEAAANFRAAAENGHVEAQYSLALCHLDGMGVPPDDAEARRWFERAAMQGGEYGEAAALELKELEAATAAGRGGGSDGT